MPLYDYLCDNCNTKFEMRRAMSESDSLAACPECESDRVERQVSRVFTVTRVESQSAMSSGCGCGGSCGCATRGG